MSQVKEKVLEMISATSCCFESERVGYSALITPCTPCSS